MMAPASRPRFQLTAFGASAHPRVSWAPVNDHRWFADVSGNLFYVADASGPTYGGYHAPFGVDPGLAAFVRALDPGKIDVRQGFAAAHQEMRQLSAAHDAVFQQKLALDPGGDRLKLAAASADAVRPGRWAELAGKSHAHFGASLTVCRFGAPDHLVVGQVGSSRAYRFRDGRLDLLCRDHTLHSAKTASGEPDPRPSFHVEVDTMLLGVDAALDVAEVQHQSRADDVYLLCSKSIWFPQGDQGLRAWLSAGPVTQQTLEEFVARCAEANRHDATAVLVRVG